MCGRFVLATPVAELGRTFGFPERPNLAPRWNVAPTQDIAFIRADRDETGLHRHLALMRWGLVPFWAGDAGIGARMINARADTLAAKPAFRDAFRHRRGLVPADGFYEWRMEEGRKQPFYIRRRDGAPMAFAGLWESWHGPKNGPAGPPLLTATIVTTDANPVLGAIHDRMPVILDAVDWDDWLDSAISPDRAAALLRPLAGDCLEVVPVSARVNSTRHDDEGCIRPLTADGEPNVQGRLL